MHTLGVSEEQARNPYIQLALRPLRIAVPTSGQGYTKTLGRRFKYSFREGTPPAFPASQEPEVSCAQLCVQCGGC